MRSYSQNGLKSTGHVLREATSHKGVVRELRNSLCKILEKLKIDSSFLQKVAKRLTRDLLTKMPLKEFFNKTYLAFWKKLITRKCYPKTLSKIYKILKNIFGFDHQAIEYTHIAFKHVQSYK